MDVSLPSQFICLFRGTKIETIVFSFFVLRFFLPH